jgi:hypothetical protein
MGKKHVIIMFILLAIPLAVIAEQKIPKDKEIIILKPDRKGNVTFTHIKHAEMRDLDCIKCHAQQANEDVYETCTQCHIRKNVRLSDKDAYHKFCISCHKRKRKKTAPVKCKECHENS